MPLAQIREVCELTPAVAARRVCAFWAGVEADLAARRELADFLVGHLLGVGYLSGQTARAGTEGAAALQIRYAVLSDIGLVRESNQDAVHAGARLLAVADGFGAGGAPASSAAVQTLIALTADPSLLVGDLLNSLQDAVIAANQAIGQITTVASDDERMTGTTLTAMVWTGSQLALVHIGDSRAYLLRAGELFQITHDHTVVQAMVDSGRLSPEEATSHPQRALLLRALDGKVVPTPEIRLHDARPGDRYLLCSDGLSAVIEDDEIRRVVGTVADPQQAVAELVQLVRAAGAPDNVSCVIADVTDNADAADVADEADVVDQADVAAADNAADADPAGVAGLR
jgi:protein phosphatase